MRFTLPAAVMLALAAPAAAADEPPTYQNVTHCAAFNLLLAQVLTAGNKADAKQAEIDNYSNQAAALMVVAATMSNLSTDKVHADVTVQNDAMIKSLNGGGAGEKLIGDNMVNCDAMGQAAKQTLDRLLADKN